MSINVHLIGNRSMYRYFWGSKEPCPCPEKKCVIMKKWSPNAYYWVPANCSEKHNYICNRTTGSGELKKTVFKISI